MVKGVYDVQEPMPPQPARAPSPTAKDKSFRSCVMAMLVFLVLCIILLIVTSQTGRWSSLQTSKSADTGTASESRGDAETTTHGPTYSEKTSKPITSTTTTTTEHPSIVITEDPTEWPLPTYRKKVVPGVTWRPIKELTTTSVRTSTVGSTTSKDTEEFGEYPYRINATKHQKEKLVVSSTSTTQAHYGSPSATTDSHEPTTTKPPSKATDSLFRILVALGDAASSTSQPETTNVSGGLVVGNFPTTPLRSTTTENPSGPTSRIYAKETSPVTRTHLTTDSLSKVSTFVPIEQTTNWEHAEGTSSAAERHLVTDSDSKPFTSGTTEQPTGGEHGEGTSHVAGKFLVTDSVSETSITATSEKPSGREHAEGTSSVTGKNLATDSVSKSFTTETTEQPTTEYAEGTSHVAGKFLVVDSVSETLTTATSEKPSVREHAEGTSSVTGNDLVTYSVSNSFTSGTTEQPTVGEVAEGTSHVTGKSLITDSVSEPLITATTEKPTLIMHMKPADETSFTTEEYVSADSSTTPSATTGKHAAGTTPTTKVFIPTNPSSVTPRMTLTSKHDPHDDVDLVSEVGPVTSSEAPIPLVCQSSECKVLASRMLSYMNHSSDPCEDFYEFACGGLQSNPALLEDNPKAHVWDSIAERLKTIDVDSPSPYRKFKNFYQSCMNYDKTYNESIRVEKAAAAVAEVGTFLDRTRPESDADLTGLLTRLLQRHSAYLFDVLLDVSPEKPPRFALKLTLPRTFSSIFRAEDSVQERCQPAVIRDADSLVDLNAMYDAYIGCTKNTSSYLDTLENSLWKFGAFEGFHEHNRSQHVREVRATVDWDVMPALDDLPSGGVARRATLNKQYDVVTVAELNTKWPLVDWRTLLSHLLGLRLDTDTKVQVYFQMELNSMFSRLERISRRSLHNALLGMFAHDLFVDLVVPRTPCGRDQYCLRVAGELMEDVSSALYLDSLGPDQQTKMNMAAQDVFRRLKETLERQLGAADWLDDGSRSAAISKLHRLLLVADGGAAVYRNESFLDVQLAEYNISYSDYFENAMSLLERYRRLMYAVYEKDPRDPEQIWSHYILPTHTEGIAIYGLNTIAVPFGMLSPPFLLPGLPRYVLMARLGMILAHEMAHHFDTTGIRQGGPGGDPLLSSESQTIFNTIVDCATFKQGYNQTTASRSHENVHYKVDTFLYVNERIADDAGLRLATDTYREWGGDGDPPLPWLGMSRDRLYFLATAQVFCSKTSPSEYGVSLFEDEHLPPFLRVNTFLSNSEQFSEAFNCPSGLPMHPSNMCESFPHISESVYFSSSESDPPV